ncbi:MAG: hypothetical protein M3N93_09905 [Acidobacteriota bacterium]|nr:hypothetical protein [Acidobacteriota bacterium]
MARVRIVHWKESHAAPLVEACRACGVEAEYDAVPFQQLAKMIRSSLPDALVIDLTCLPGQGREAAVYLRRTKYARHLPLVFVDGDIEKVKKVKEQLPDATFTTRLRLCPKLSAALRNRVADPVLPPPMEARFALRTVAQKLGIKPGSRAAVIEAPRNYAAVIGELPAGAELVEDPASSCAVTLCFVEAPGVLKDLLSRTAKLANRTKLWILWRKGGAGEPMLKLTPKLIREAGIEAGLVDYKICGANAQWSAMAFARKKF